MRKFSSVCFLDLNEKISAGRPEVPQNVNGMRTKARVQALMLVAAMAAIISGCGGGHGSSFSPASVDSSLGVTPATVDFGDVNVGTAVSKSVIITNQSVAAVELDQL